MKKIFAFLAIFTLVLTGCSKKQDSVEQKATKVASNASAFVQTSENEFVVVSDESPELEEFAFVDEDSDSEDVNYLAEDDIDLIESEESLEDIDLNSDSYVALDEKELKFENIQYAINGREPLASQKEVISKNIETAKQAVEQGSSISVNGYCCELGDAKFNMGLSVKRANAIKEEMLKNGIPEDKVIVVGCGQECPLVESTSEDKNTRVNELAPNRRVEIYALNND